MTKISMGKYLGLVLLLSVTAYTQQSSLNKPLGDVAREQQAAHAQQKKSSIVHTEVDGSIAPEASDASPTSSAKSATAQDVKAPKSLAKSPAQSGPQSVLDRPLGEKPDPYVVPAGTEIRVDLTESKITVPVRLGFATPIPALTKVAVQTDRTYFQTVYGAYGADNPGYVEYSTLTAVTVDGKTYPVQTNRVQVNGASASANGGTSVSSSRDAMFILSAPITIER